MRSLGRSARYIKLPEAWNFGDEMPCNETGKLLRRV
jgi:acyl-coenzyme A synthetase/AMP-(fatty) acid ligase